MLRVWIIPAVVALICQLVKWHTRDGKANSCVGVVKGKWESKQWEVLVFKWKVEKLRKLRHSSLLGEHLKCADLKPSHLTEWLWVSGKAWNLEPDTPDFPSLKPRLVLKLVVWVKCYLHHLILQYQPLRCDSQCCTVPSHTLPVLFYLLSPGKRL